MSSELLKKLLHSTFSSPQEELGNLVLKRIHVETHELVLHVKDSSSSLEAIIAIHNTSLGPSLGGTRIYPYPSFEAALKDVLRLSEGMTHKAALAEVGFGGGKSVIIADPQKGGKEPLLASFARAVHSLSGLYICAEDAGCSPEDLLIVHAITPYVVGLPHEKSSGNPSRFTAWGVFRGIQATAHALFGSDSLEGKTVAVQGLGQVGEKLLSHLFWAGASLVISDLNMDKASHLAAQFGARAVSAEEILSIECDILAPCAMGGILNRISIPTLRCKGIAGGANNQLDKEGDSWLLRNRGILYAPDFVINAGGLLNVTAELEPTGYHPSSPRAKVHQIYDTLTAIYEIAEKNDESPLKAALSLSEYRIQHKIGERTSPPIFHHTERGSKSFASV